MLWVKLMKYIRNVLAALRRADRDFSLINEGDKIIVGLSGGKDSLTLLRALSVYGHFAGKHFVVQPVYLDLGFGKSNMEPLQKYCESLDYKLIINDSTFVYDILKAHTKANHHIPCSICSRMKKAAINNVAKELGFNKVAFAHHNDDAVETLFMNMVHGGRVATFEPKMKLERAGITFIRPLIYAKESDIRNLAKEENLPVLTSLCPANGFTEREWTKELLNSIYTTHPEARDNFRSMLSNYKAFTLYFETIAYENESDHNLTLKPVVNANDMRETSFSKRKAKEGEQDYLIQYQGKKVGEIACYYTLDHDATIFSLVGQEKYLRLAIEQLGEKLAKETNPLTITLLGVKEKLATSLGYVKNVEYGQKTPHYHKRYAI